MAADRLLLGTRKGTFVFKRSGSNWTLQHHAHPGARVSYVDIDPRTGRLWSGLDHGHWGTKLEYSDDGGATFTEVPAPAYPAGAEIREPHGGPESTKTVPATLQYIWGFAAGSAAQQGRLYLGTVPGGLFVSDDHGATWTINESLWNHPTRMKGWFGGGMDQPGIHSICIDPRSDQTLRIAISCAGVFLTTDGGRTWKPTNKGLSAEFLPDPSVEVGHDPHLLVQCPGQPDKLWQQNHCGIFMSADGGQTWAAVSKPDAGHDGGAPAHFGFAVAVDEKNGDVAWVVPAASDQNRMAVDGKLCVCRTDDAGKTWQAFRKGLPQETCYDIVYRHGLALKGDELAFGSTTGNVFFSPDRGESWQTVGNYLPPVHSVRFA